MPEGLRRHRELHQYLGPGCLCALFEQIGDWLVFTEAAIYITKVEPYKGEYIAGCAKSHCGYLGRSLFSHFLSKASAHTFGSSTAREDVYEDRSSVEILPSTRLDYKVLDATSAHLL